MYISKILLNVTIPLVRSDLASPGRIKSTLKKVVNSSRFIYRIENVPLDKNAYQQPIVLVSENKPDMAASGKPSGFFSAVETYEYRIPVRQGMVYRFFLKANPSAKIFFFNSDILERELQIKWLESESVSNGFQLLDCNVTQDGYITCSEDRIKFLSAIFEGSFKITDEDKFTKMLHNGIGRGKEYGLGLVSVESYGCKNRNIAEEMKNSPEFSCN
ncbi:MAG: type I-E CRISPR-associated protein Cas6/Cse3/CasE [Spirochaetes bacterium]|nr:type I-E CRISPR-associated protein Cas6/Cse3/CasE [Spirochaetota bacterium]